MNNEEKNGVIIENLEEALSKDKAYIYLIEMEDL